MPIILNNTIVITMRNYYLDACRRWPNKIIKAVAPEVYHGILSTLKREYPHDLKMDTTYRNASI